MSVEKIGPQPDGKSKKTQGVEPDSESFKEMMRVGETPETSLEQRKKGKFKGILEEEEELIAPLQKRAPKQSSDIFKKEAKAKIEKDEKEVPISPKVYHELSEKKIDPFSKEKELIVKIDKDMKQLKPSSRERAAQEIKAHLSSKEAEALEKKTMSVKEEEKKEKKKETTKEIEKEKKHREKEHFKKEGTEREKKGPQTLILPQNVENQVALITPKVESFLSHEITPIFEQMVGTIIVLEKKGISQTQIILNNPQFSNSRFYNATITFEKYSTAPNSYNITLATPNQEAYTVFIDSLPNIQMALTKTDLDFEIGRISAEYEVEPPIFKRRPKIQESKKEER